MPDRLSRLFEKYINNNCSQQELKEFWEIINGLQDNNFLTEELKAAWDDAGSVAIHKQELFNKVLARAKEQEAPKQKVNYTRIAAAAVIVLLLSVGGYFYFNKGMLRETQHDIAAIKNDVGPGRKGAILTLANGKTIVLDTASNGKLLDNFTKSGESITVESAVMEYATLTTPKARTQQLTLSDGSKVWLNAASSIHFPTVFPGKERIVEITGEVYFEVAKNASKPFYVKVNDMQVEVLGTHFNVNAYSDEGAIKTTLIEGSVMVSIVNGQQSAVIKPGQQAQAIGSQLKVINDANINAIIAWKNGQFRFESQDIETIMRQISRWYDVEINYKAKTDKHFTGIISRNVNASEVLKMLEMTGEMHFSIDGKKVTVEK